MKRQLRNLRLELLKKNHCTDPQEVVLRQLQFILIDRFVQVHEDKNKKKF